MEVVFSDKVEYRSGSAQTIAFLKREMYTVLDLKSAGADTLQSLDISLASSQQTAHSTVDLSNQLQVVNLGYLGKKSNIFELASTYVDFSFLPLFTDFKAKSSGQSGAGGASSNDIATASSQSLDQIMKELTSLKMHLASARQNSIIP